jgi:hypothetical protein
MACCNQDAAHARVRASCGIASSNDAPSPGAPVCVRLMIGLDLAGVDGDMADCDLAPRDLSGESGTQPSPRLTSLSLRFEPLPPCCKVVSVAGLFADAIMSIQ